MNLEKHVNETFQALIDSGRVNEILEEKVEKLITDTFESTMRGYSPFGKALKEYIEGTILKIDPDRLGFAAYNEMVMDALKRQLDKYIDQGFRADLEAQIRDLLVGAPEEVALTELLRDYMECHEDDARDEESEYGCCLVEASEYGFRHIGLDWTPLKEGDGRDRSFDYRCRLMLNKKNELVSVQMKGEELRVLLTGNLYGFERRLFQMRTAGTRVLIDVPEEDEYHEYYSWAS